VLLCVLLLQGKDESGKPVTDYWKPSLGLLADKDLIGKLKSYDKDNIPPKWVTVAAVGQVLVFVPYVK
jgi:dynein heavy chain